MKQPSRITSLLMDPRRLEAPSPGENIREAGDARLSVFLGRHGWQFGILGSFLTILISVAVIGLGVAEVRGGLTEAPPIDFVVFWGAAKLAFNGDWIGAFDAETLRAAHGAEVDEWFPWAYPPGFLLLLMPLGAVGFASAWLIFSASSLAAMALAVRPYAGRALPVWLAFAFAPAYLPAILLAQTTLLWMAGLLFALAAMQSGRAILAGVLIGLLTFKPQLGILIPIALIASRQWSTIAAAVVTTVIVSVLPTLYFGVEYWAALREVGAAHYEFVKERVGDSYLMPSVYAELRMLEFEHLPAITGQWFVAGVAALVVARVWMGPSTDFDLRAAALVAAIPLSTPYLWYYDSAFVALSALFMLRAGLLRFSLAEFPLLALLWLGAGLSGVVELLTPQTNIPVRDLVLPVIVLAFAIAARAALRGAAAEVRVAA